MRGLLERIATSRYTADEIFRGHTYLLTNLRMHRPIILQTLTASIQRTTPNATAQKRHEPSPLQGRPANGRSSVPACVQRQPKKTHRAYIGNKARFRHRSSLGRARPCRGGPETLFAAKLPPSLESGRAVLGNTEQSSCTVDTNNGRD